MANALPRSRPLSSNIYADEGELEVGMEAADKAKAAKNAPLSLAASTLIAFCKTTTAKAKAAYLKPV